MEINIYNIQKEVVGKKVLNEKLFLADVNEGLIHTAVVSHLANLRRGTSAAKGRTDVKGSGKKPWKQKGTGNARAGRVTSPLWRGGGITFGPQPRDYSFKVNKKVRRGSLVSALSLKAKNNQIVIVDKFSFEEPKTKGAVAIFKRMGVGRKVLIVTDTKDEYLFLSVRNIVGIRNLDVNSLNTFDIVSCDTLVFTELALARLEEGFGNE
jgi:large subunit ribosomal protein L4